MLICRVQSVRSRDNGTVFIPVILHIFFLDDFFNQHTKKIGNWPDVHRVSISPFSCLSWFIFLSIYCGTTDKGSSLRKVLAWFSSIISLLWKIYILIVFANLVAGRCRIWSLVTWLEGYAFILILARGYFWFRVMMVVLIGTLTVAIIPSRIARTNPVNCLAVRLIVSEWASTYQGVLIVCLQYIIREVKSVQCTALCITQAIRHWPFCFCFVF